jgi:hypothetical protein
MPVSTRPLGALRRLLAALLVLDVLAVASSLTSLISGDGDTGMTIYASDTPSSAPVPVPAGLHASTLGVSILDPTGWEKFLGLLSHNFTLALFALPMLIVARRLIDRATDTHPFTAGMAHGLRRLGILVLVGGVIAEAVRITADILLHVSAVPGTDPIDLFPDTISVWWLLVGLTVIGFAQIIAYGNTLRAELDEVI